MNIISRVPEKSKGDNHRALITHCSRRQDPMEKCFPMFSNSPTHRQAGDNQTSNCPFPPSSILGTLRSCRVFLRRQAINFVSVSSHCENVLTKASNRQMQQLNCSDESVFRIRYLFGNMYKHAHTLLGALELTSNHNQINTSQTR